MRVLGPNDGVEQVLTSLERITGTRQTACPWRAYEDPFVAEVLRAHRHWKERQLHLVWGHDPPAALMRGIEVYDSALNAIRANDIHEDREKRKREHESEMNKRAQKSRRPR